MSKKKLADCLGMDTSQFYEFHGGCKCYEKEHDRYADALRELYGRLGLCHGAIMGYGCQEPFHSPKCATATIPKEKP